MTGLAVVAALALSANSGPVVFGDRSSWYVLSRSGELLERLTDVQGEVTCNENTTLECKKPRSGGPLGAYVVDRGSCGAPSDRVFWCNLKLSADQAARILVHEAAHTCGWDHCQGHGVPDNGCGSNELR